MVFGAIKARHTGKLALFAGLEFLVIITLGTLDRVGISLLLAAG